MQPGRFLSIQVLRAIAAGFVAYHHLLQVMDKYYPESSVHLSGSTRELLGAMRRQLELLQEVGLGYLTLGQQSPTLSGGEAQRIKLVTELAKAKGHEPDVTSQRLGALYVLDEPTIGLHMADVEKLFRVLHRLVDAGNTVVIIEHNLDIIAEADWIIDLGPEGGDGGGRLVAEGSPVQVARTRSHTGTVLRDFLRQHNRGTA